MIRLAVRRLAWALLAAAAASIIAFVLFWAVPNVDPAFRLGGQRIGTDETRAQAAERHGLNDPLPIQYVRLMGGIVVGDVNCFYHCSDLRQSFLEALPVTLSLVLGAAVLAIGAGTLLAMVCVRHRGGRLDRALTTAAVVAYSVPSLVLSALLWAFLASKWEIFPDDGYVALTANPLDWAWHLLLPWIAAALPFTGAYVLIVRAALLESADEDWVRAARAKGLSERAIVRRHVLRNALAPPINIWGLDFSHAFGGFALYVEVIFGLPGVGALTDTTLRAYDLPPIVALAVWLTFVVVLVSALVDLLVAWLDPRVRVSARGAAT